MEEDNEGDEDLFELRNSDKDDKSVDQSSPVPIKFTGRNAVDATSSSFFSTPSAGGGGDTPRERMERREMNLVSAATSPMSYTIQAAVLVFVFAFVIYVGASGQLGLNEDYEDDEAFSPVPIPQERTSVWL